MDDTLEKLSQISTLSPEAIKRITEEVMENNQKLRQCEKHDFSEQVKDPGMVSKRWVCSSCNGRVDAIRKQWYEIGVQHGKKL